MFSNTPIIVTTTMVPTAPLPLVVTITTGGGTFTTGQSHTLACQVSGGDITTTSYQWLKNDQIINGQTSSTLSFSPLREADTGRYNCRGTRGSFTSTSRDVVITVNGELHMYSISKNCYLLMIYNSTNILSHYFK